VRSCSGSRTVKSAIENNGSEGFGAIGFVVVKEAFSFRGAVRERLLFDAGFFGDSAIGDSACSFLPIFRTPPLDLLTDFKYSACMTVSPFRKLNLNLRRSVSSAGETVTLFNYAADILYIRATTRIKPDISLKYSIERMSWISFWFADPVL